MAAQWIYRFATFAIACVLLGCTVRITDLTGTVPIANAGAEQTVNEGTRVTLDGSSSADSNGLELSYAWTQTAGEPVTLSDGTAVMPTFTAPQVNSQTTLTFELSVSNGTDSDTDTVEVLVQGGSSALSAEATATPNSVAVGDQVILSGSASGGVLPFEFSWEQTSGPESEMSLIISQAAPAPSAGITLMEAGTVVYALTVTDANGDTATAEVSIAVAVAVAEPSQVVAPTFNPDGGAFPSGTVPFIGSVFVTISSATSGATIRYSVDGSTPSDTSAIYSGAITLTSTTTINAVATVDGVTDSPVASTTFTRTGQTVAERLEELGWNENEALAVAERVRASTLRYLGGTAWVAGTDLIATVAHVVGHDTAIGSTLTFQTITGTEISAVLLESLEADDMAVLRVTSDLGALPPPLSLASAVPGEAALAVGHPYNVGRWVVTVGEIVSIDPLDGSILADLSTTSGNSGGPVVNRNGEVVGTVGGSTTPGTSSDVYDLVIILDLDDYASPTFTTMRNLAEMIERHR